MSMAMAELKTVVAKAIREADNSYFSEDYEKQAAAALKAIEKHGLVLMPKEAPEDIYAKVSNLIPTGRVRPEDLVRSIYNLTVTHLRCKS